MTYQSTIRPRHSRWGAVQQADEIAPGIWLVSTASHGGFMLSPERNATVPAYMRDRSGAYEEDCDCAVVIVAFPDLFNPAQLESADLTLRNWYPDAWERFNGAKLHDSQSLKRREQAFSRANEGALVSGSAFGDWAAWVPAGKVGLYARTLANGVPTGADRVFLVDAERYRTRGAHAYVIDTAVDVEIDKPANPCAKAA